MSRLVVAVLAGIALVLGACAGERVPTSPAPPPPLAPRTELPPPPPQPLPPQMSGAGGAALHCGEGNVRVDPPALRARCDAGGGIGFGGFTCEPDNPAEFGDPVHPDLITNKACTYLDEHGHVRSHGPWIDEQRKAARGAREGAGERVLREESAVPSAPGRTGSGSAPAPSCAAPSCGTESGAAPSPGTGPGPRAETGSGAAPETSTESGSGAEAGTGETGSPTGTDRTGTGWSSTEQTGVGETGGSGS